MLKRKQKFDSFNDGVLYYGDYLENYDENNNACNEKEFSIKGKLFFSYKTIREQDSLKYSDTGLIMGNNKSQLVVAAIENGTVIDHIPAEKTYQIVSQHGCVLLHLSCILLP